MSEDLFDHSLKHAKLTGVIRDAIVRGEFRPGDRLPSQNEMAHEYGLSPSTIREAISSLVHEGLLRRVQGKGTFVAELKANPVTIAAVMPHLYQKGDAQYGSGYNILPCLVQSIEKGAREYGANLMLYLADDSPGLERRNLLSLIDHKVDAAIAFYIGQEHNLDCIDRLQDAGIPFVLIDRYLASRDTDYVVSDNQDAAYRVTRALIDRGFERIFYLTQDVADTSVQDRAAGYLRAVDEFGLDRRVWDLPVAPGDTENVELPTIAASEAAARELLNDARRPFAVFAENAHVLAGVWQAIRQSDLRPDDYALACFDEAFMSLSDDVLFIHAVQPLEEMGLRSVQVLMERLNGRSEPQGVVLPSEIRISGRD